MNKAILLIIAATLFILGIIVGSFIKNIPYFTWATEVQVGDVANAILALALAIVIPFWLTKWLDDNKGVKQFLINEVSLLSNDLQVIKSKIDHSYRCKSLSKEDKKEINLLFEHLDRRLNSLVIQIESAYLRKSKDDIANLKESNTKYWKAITSGEFMEEDFLNIPPDFWKASLDAYFQYESAIKKMAHKINRY